jgi:hypothetical protein
VRFEQAGIIDAARSISGQWTFITRPAKSAPSSDPPTSSGHFVTLFDLEEAIASLIVESFQESVRKVRIIPAGTGETGKVYTTPLAGAQSFATPGAGNQCLVEIVDMGAASFVTMATGSLIDYVHFRGSGHHVGVHFAFNSATKICKIENMTAILGGQSGTYSARSFQSLEFHNCIIHHYHALTLTSCPLVKDCLFLGSSTNAVTLAGSTKVMNSRFNNVVINSSSGYTDYIDDFTFAPPTDPTDGV